MSVPDREDESLEKGCRKRECSHVRHGYQAMTLLGLSVDPCYPSGNIDLPEEDQAHGCYCCSCGKIPLFRVCFPNWNRNSSSPLGDDDTHWQSSRPTVEARHEEHSHVGGCGWPPVWW
jgi:hypothetical protein